MTVIGSSVITIIFTYMIAAHCKQPRTSQGAKNGGHPIFHAIKFRPHQSQRNRLVSLQVPLFGQF